MAIMYEKYNDKYTFQSSCKLKKNNFMQLFHVFLLLLQIISEQITIFQFKMCKRCSLPCYVGNCKCFFKRFVFFLRKHCFSLFVMNSKGYISVIYKRFIFKFKETLFFPLFVNICFKTLILRKLVSSNWIQNYLSKLCNYCDTLRKHFEITKIITTLQ